MFARDKRIGPYTYVYLVENVREEGRTKQRIIANLGRKEVVVARGDLDRLALSVVRVLAWFKKIVPFLPPSVFAWDNAANNKWLISGQGALIMNPPGAWAVAVRDATAVAEQ